MLLLDCRNKKGEITNRDSNSAPIKSSLCYVVLIIKLTLAGLIIWALSHYGLLDISNLSVALRHPWLLALSCLVTLLTIPLATIRWLLLLNSQDVTVSFWQAFLVNYNATFCNTFLPGGAGGEALRMAYIIRRYPGKRSFGMLSVLIDRLLGLMGLLSLTSLAWFSQIDLVLSHPSLFSLGIAALALLLAGAIGLTMGGKICRRLSGRFDAEWAARGGRLRSLVWKGLAAITFLANQPRLLFRSMIISLLVHLLVVLGLLLMAKALDIASLPLGSFTLAATMSIVANMLPLTPGGLGIGEGVFANLCILLDPAASSAPFATAMLGFRALSGLVSFPGLLLYMGQWRRQTPPPATPAP